MRSSSLVLAIVAVFCCQLAAANSTPALKSIGYERWNVCTVVEGWHYPCKEHTVQTQDGFLLALQRIPHGIKSPQAPQKPVVILQHGFLDSGLTWLMSDPEHSFAYLLADAGFDVWLSNSRGNGVSLSSVHYTPSQPEFWAWSFDEMATYDLPAVIDYILGQTSQQQLFYIGHSQGTSIAFAALENSSLAAKVKVFVALAPVASMRDLSALYLKLLSELSDSTIYSLMGNEGVLMNENTLEKLVPGFCKYFPGACDDVVCLIAGCEQNNLNATDFPFLFSHYPAPTSVQDLVHWAQMARTGIFQMYDYGTQGNLQHYNQSTPPVYSPDQVGCPVAVYYGGQDQLADPEDVAALLKLLENNGIDLLATQEISTYGHADFVWGDDAVTILYNPIIQLLQQQL